MVLPAVSPSDGCLSGRWGGSPLSSHPPWCEQERKKQEAGGEGKKREDAPPPEPEVVVPPLPKLAKADLKQLQVWVKGYPRQARAHAHTHTRPDTHAGALRSAGPSSSRGRRRRRGGGARSACRPWGPRSRYTHRRPQPSVASLPHPHSSPQINSEPAPPCISSEALRGLEEVDLSGCRGISDASCVVLAALCPSLTTLRLCGCSQV